MGSGHSAVGGRGHAHRAEDHDRAHAQASEALSLFQEIEDPRGIAWSLEVLAGLRAAEGQADRAARLWSASEALRERVGAALPPNLKMLRDRYIDSVKESLGSARVQGCCPPKGVQCRSRGHLHSPVERRYLPILPCRNEPLVPAPLA